MTTITLRKAKCSAAVLLVCAICLPLGECSKPGNASRPHVDSFTQQAFPRDDAQFSYTYGFEKVDLSGFGAMTLLAFTWPLLLCLVGGRMAASRFSWLLHLFELLLCGGTLYWLYVLAWRMSDRRLYGAYIVIAVVAAYGALTLLSLFYFTRTLVIRRRGLTRR